MDDREQKRLLDAAAPLIEMALVEDGAWEDPTSRAIFPANEEVDAWIVAKQKGVVAGLAIAEVVFQRIDSDVRFESLLRDGWPIMPGERIARVRGRAVSVLAAERAALNFLQRMSGIATATAAYVDVVACTGTRILDTRKTCPGHRVLDKYAVRMGGGENHRMNLKDMALIKDNHIDTAGGIGRAIERVRSYAPDLPVEVEVRTIDELAEVLLIDPFIERIMCDNMDLATLRQAVALVDGRIPIEASGKVSLEGLPKIAASGVDFISVGRLTHSAPALDLSLEIFPGGTGETPERDHGDRIREIKRHFGDDLVILAHHYQRDEVVEAGDYRGDSLELVRLATHTPARYIVFCGVYFMAETAAILASPGRRVVIPEPTAGCYLADTASPSDVQTAWSNLAGIFGRVDQEVTPITYVNSSASLKAFCGRYGGYVCTSANARDILERALRERPRVFFFPNQHLGRNTAAACGIPAEEILLWNPGHVPLPNRVQNSRVILWPGACNVHRRFRPEMVRTVRERFLGVRVLVHPECERSVVLSADEMGSTSAMIRRVTEAPAGSRWAMGTEERLVNRLQRENPAKTIVPLSPVPAVCPTMSQTTLASLRAVLEELVLGRVPNEIRVDEETARHAKAALNRMLSVRRENLDSACELAPDV
ncbi:MAG TPA: quinolinate synthase NadA [Atribacteraceae bacterium]|nr:quinolinate synthase NadA [Atribacteraceae bacterium]